MKNLGLRKHALSILKKCGCDRDTYKTSDCWEDETVDGRIAQTIKDVTESKSEDAWLYQALCCHKKYTAEQIMREMFAIGDEVKPKKADKYHLIWDNEHCTDGFDCGNNKKSLKDIMENFLIDWMLQFNDQDDKSEDAWNYMIDNCWCRCYRNADLGPDVDLDDIWCCYLTEKELKTIGWENTYEMDDDTYNTCADLYGWKKRT